MLPTLLLLFRFLWFPKGFSFRTSTALLISYIVPGHKFATHATATRHAPSQAGHRRRRRGGLWVIRYYVLHINVLLSVMYLLATCIYWIITSTDGRKDARINKHNNWIKSTVSTLVFSVKRCYVYIIVLRLLCVVGRELVTADKENRRKLRHRRERDEKDRKERRQKRQEQQQ